MCKSFKVTIPIFYDHSIASCCVYEKVKRRKGSEKKKKKTEGAKVEEDTGEENCGGAVK
jgi:hypothetical protein